MWSLPDIAVMNSRAAAKKPSLLKAVGTGIDPETGKQATCEREDQNCSGNVRGEPWFDIFSDDPKGVVFLCENHGGDYNRDEYFRCEDCERLMLDHITWERYVHDTEDGPICLNCYAKRVMDDPKSWVPLTKARIDMVDFSLLRKAPHIIAVSGPTHGLVHYGSATFDSMSGNCISGGGLDEIKGALHNARKEGKRKALIVLCAAYQFCVELGVFTR
jgi:hypothetical protein